MNQQFVKKASKRVKVLTQWGLASYEVSVFLFEIDKKASFGAAK
jgi:hypothetical protein